jgi:hypothetical protein
LIEADVTALDRAVPQSDLGISVMVMEHVHDDSEFVRIASTLVRPGGYLAICVPARKDKWSFEDEMVGHLRRYDRGDLQRVLETGGLTDINIWSIAVPTANLLFHIGEWLVRRSDEVTRVGLSQRDQTERSGVRHIPWKTAFPPWTGLVLNRYMMLPLFILQRLFYRTAFGVTMLGFGRVPGPG